jgi:hypothetical protein
MSDSPSGSGPPEDAAPDASEAPDPTDEPASSASSPEEARRQAEDALAEIEAMADLDDPSALDADASAAPSEETAPSDASPAAEGADAATADGQEDAPDATIPPHDPDAASGEAAPTAADDEDDDAADGPLEDQCENCGALLHGPYCSQCGQKAADRIMPIWHMINEALEAVVELDLRVLYTLPKFLFLPGRLTKEYINGRRKRYIRPFRLYLFSTFLLFAVLALTTTGNFGFVLDPQGRTRFNPPNTGINLGGGGADSTTTTTTFFENRAQQEALAQQLESDSVKINLGIYDDPAANERLEQLLKQRSAQAVRNPWEFVGSLIDRGPYLMFLMLPIFAFFLKLLYIRRSRFYVEHLIFSLHLHAFTFFAFTAGILMQQSDLGWLQTAGLWVEVSPLLYLVVALSHVYDQGLIKSTFKAFMLLLIYTNVLAVGFVLLMILSVLFM